jgi:hypothetical protein
MSKLGKRLTKAAEETLAIARGELDPSTYRVHVPADVDVRKIRKELKLSQDEFAAESVFRPRLFGIGSRTDAARRALRACCSMSSKKSRTP